MLEVMVELVSVLSWVLREQLVRDADGERSVLGVQHETETLFVLISESHPTIFFSVEFLLLWRGRLLWRWMK